jgi:hypothetical protein
MLNITIHRKVMANIRKKWVFFINIKKNCVNAKFLRDLDPHAPVKQYFLSLSRLPLSLSHYSIIEADKDAADSDAGFLVRVHPDPCPDSCRAVRIKVKVHPCPDLNFDGSRQKNRPQS